jgi:hypothetical protein
LTIAPRLTGVDQSEYFAAEVAREWTMRSTLVTSPDVHARSAAAAARVKVVRVRA